MRVTRSEEVVRPAASAAGAVVPALDSPSLYINRELSWLAFNERVLNQARDRRHPLLERVKFLAIVGTNLDEFFMIRVAVLHKQMRTHREHVSPDGLTTEQQLALVRARARQMLDEQARCWTDALRPELAAHGIRFLDPNEYPEDLSAYLAGHFQREIAPVLTPLAFDPGHPFPHISNRSKNLAVAVKHEGRTKFARIKLPPALPRFLPLPPAFAAGGSAFVFIEDVVCANVESLFPGTTVKSAHVFRVIRDTDMVIQEDEADDLLETVDQGLRQLRHGAPSLLQVEERMPRRVLDILVENFEIEDEVLVRTSHRLGFGDWMDLMRLHRPELKDPNFAPRTVWGRNDVDEVFELVRHRDYMLHHPFDSFVAVETFLKAAVRDPHVVTIKLTLYRIGHDSPLIDLLEEAAEAGKQVAVLVELKARFDERNNITWATRLEAAGVHVVYGLVNLKTHCKLCLVVRNEPDGIRRYAHIGTGNYNESTSRIYTDVALVTTRPAIVDDVSNVFNYLTGYSAMTDYRELLVAPVSLRRRLYELIERERTHAAEGRPAKIVFKINSITDTGDNPGAVPRLSGRSADRPHRARHLLSASGHSRRQRTHYRPLNRRTVPRTLAHLLVREWRQSAGVHRQRRSDGAEPGSARGGVVPGTRSQPARVFAGHSARRVPARHRSRGGPQPRWRVQARDVERRRRSLQRAGLPARPSHDRLRVRRERSLYCS